MSLVGFDKLSMLIVSPPADEKGEAQVLFISINMGSFRCPFLIGLFLLLRWPYSEPLSSSVIRTRVRVKVRVRVRVGDRFKLYPRVAFFPMFASMI